MLLVSCVHMWCSLHGRHGHGHIRVYNTGTTTRHPFSFLPLSLLSSLVPGGEEELLGPGRGGEVGRRVDKPELARGEHAFGVAIVGPRGGVVWKEGGGREG